MDWNKKQTSSLSSKRNSDDKKSVRNLSANGKGIISQNYILNIKNTDKRMQNEVWIIVISNNLS